MVLWEITLATAYFLGLKRTYSLALKIQRRLIPHKHLKIRQFAQRRTRAIFNVALKVHQNIQQRDIEVGRNVRSWIFGWLEKMKPSANILGATQEKLPPGNLHQYGTSMKKLLMRHNQKNDGGIQKFNSRRFKEGSYRLLFSITRPTWSTSLPRITKLLQLPSPAVSNTQYRQLCFGGPQLLAPSYGSLVSGGVVREDIRLWMNRY